ncbi:MAG: XRE family transcriptional regulator [Caldilineaceae bacterium SB0662_bin_9]|uniref:XRE family transcriptional regulator n=1 Tax=Caldilineaceae bacterium SB0662_bin_9 TaxID=2605258 RepID=A0A6B1DQK9_9CHLR|nr:XRE family transcriptional regulator [Caldilineaceae bacterium SB0662_bin_9]
MKSNNVKIERGSGNVFADLEFPDADAHLLKAELVTRIEMIIRERGLKQVEAAKLLGLSQPDVSRLLRGNFREFSMERLLRLLTVLGRDVDIVIRESHSEQPGRLSVSGEIA